MHSYKSPPSSLSVKLNQDKRSPVPHFLWSLAKPCSPFPNLHLPQPGPTPSLCLGRHLQPELPIPLACRAAPLPAPLFTKKVAEDFLQEVCCQAAPVTGFKPITKKCQAEPELVLASSSLCVRDGRSWMQQRKLYQDRCLNPRTRKLKKLIRNSFLHQHMINVWNSLP